MSNAKYPECPNCGAEMEPIWFTEKEINTTFSGASYYTGRKRRNVNYFQCPFCMKKETVDDTFAMPWQK